MDAIRKMLAHRLRGFDRIEHTKEALERAVAAGVPYLEFDTRVSRDGQIYVYHDPVTSEPLSNNLRFHTSSSSELEKLRYHDGQTLLELDELLEYFSLHGKDDQKLVVEIKDFGHELDYLNRLKKYHLEDRAVWISWIPQSLFKLRELGARSPFVLSLWNLKKFSVLGAMVSTLLSPFIFKISYFVVVGDRRVQSDLGNLTHGFQHSMVSTKLPDSVVKLLVESSGGICVNSSVVCSALKDACSEDGLQLWSYGYPTVESYMAAANDPGIQVLFCEQGAEVLARGNTLLSMPE